MCTLANSFACKELGSVRPTPLKNFDGEGYQYATQSRCLQNIKGCLNTREETQHASHCLQQEVCNLLCQMFPKKVKQTKQTVPDECYSSHWKSLREPGRFKLLTK